MWVQDFEVFYQQAELLFRARPLETRYVIKYRHTDGVLVLKVTDDRTCLKFKTDQQVDLRRVERLNTLFFALTSSGADAVPPGGPSAAGEQLAPSALQPPQQHQQHPPHQGGKKSRKKG